MHTLPFAPVCHDAPISPRDVPVFPVQIHPSGQIMKVSSLTDSGVVRGVPYIDRPAHEINTKRRRWRYVKAANDLPQHSVPNHAPSLAAERHLKLVRRDEQNAAISAAVEAFRKHVPDERGELVEYPDLTLVGPTLFRYTGYDGVQCAFSIPRDRLTGHVRALIYELAEAVEDEGRR